MIGRTFGVAAATVALGFTTFASAPRADQPDAARPIERLEPAAQSGPLAPIVGPVSPFQGAPMGAAARFSDSPSQPPADGFAALSAPASDWRDAEFASVGILDGRTILADGVRIRLLGLDLPIPEQACRTLDGRLELCATRAATQLELLTRWKRVACHYRAAGAGEAVGRCRIGTNDLTDRMIKTGYTWRSAVAADRG